MFSKRLFTFLAIFALSTGLVLAADTAPCTRPLKHLNCQDLKDLAVRKQCTPDPVPACPEVTCPEPEECNPVQVFVPVPFETIKEVPVEVRIPVPVCDAKDFVKQWNIQAVGGQNNFIGLQGRFKNFGLRVGQYDIEKAPSFAIQEVAAATMGSGRNDNDPVTICHRGRTIVVDNDAVPGHLGHGDTIGACSIEPPICNDGICRNECPQNCDEPPACDDGVCRTECPLNCDEPSPCDDGICRTECPQNCDEPPNCNDGICREECPQNCDEPPTCEDGICRTECPQNCDNPPSCTDGVCREECPLNCGDPGPESRKLARIDTGHAYTIEGLYFIPLPNNCANFSLYVGAGVTRKTQETLWQDIQSGYIFKTDKDNEYRPSGTIGAEYRLPFSMVVGGGYSTASGFLLHAGYSYRFK